jgi:hypothetical protein
MARARRRSPLGALLPLLGLAAAAAGGCATHPTSGFETAVDFAGLRASLAVPAALRAMAPLPPAALFVTVLPARGGPAPGAQADDDEIPFDARVIGDELALLLESTGVFTKVFPVGERERSDLFRAKEEADRGGASFLIEAEVAAPVLRRTDRAFVLPMLVWMTAGFPSWWFYNHEYELGAGLRLRVHGLASGDMLPERPVRKPLRRERMNFFERTGSFWPYLVSYVFPTPFLPIDEQKVARFLAASALREPVADLLDELAQALTGGVYAFAVEAPAPAPEAPPGGSIEVDTRAASPAPAQGGAGAVAGGPEIRIEYPPVDGRPVYLLAKRARYAATVESASAEIREVEVDGRRDFPAKTDLGEIAYRSVPIESRAEVRPGGGVLVEIVATDAAGRKTACRIRARPIGRSGKAAD